MSKTKTGKAYFDQANALKERGFNSKVQALPDEQREYLDELLEKNFGDRQIAKEMNERFKLASSFEFGNLSNVAVSTYRKIWEKKRALTMAGAKTLGLDVKVLEDFKKRFEEANVSTIMIELLMNLMDAIKKSDELQKDMPMYTDSNLELKIAATKLCKDIIDTAIKLGLYPKVDQELPKGGEMYIKGDDVFVKAVMNLMKESKAVQEDKKTK